MIRHSFNQEELPTPVKWFVHDKYTHELTDVDGAKHPFRAVTIGEGPYSGVTFAFDRIQFNEDESTLEHRHLVVNFIVLSHPDFMDGKKLAEDKGLQLVVVSIFNQLLMDTITGKDSPKENGESVEAESVNPD